MAEKKFLSWVGFKAENTSAAPQSEESDAPVSGSQSNVARIRELENQLAELRSRRDLTSLTKEEFEILASETAMTLIKTAQSREAKALAVAQKAISESTASARALVESAEAKSKSLLSQAESRGRKYIEAAQSDAEAALEEATKDAEHLINSKKREAGTILSGAKKEAEEMVSGAVSEIASYRGWLSTAIAEAERLHRIQTQSLNAAEQAIEQTRQRLSSAFEKLASLQIDIDSNLDSDNRPRTKNYVRLAPPADIDLSVPDVPVRAPKAKKAAKKTAKKTVKKPAKKTPVKKAPVKKAPAKKKSAKKTAAKRK